MSRRFWVVAALVAVAPGCSDTNKKKTPDQRSAAPDPTGKLKITTVPPGAAVIEGGEERLGRTPITVTRPAFERLDLQLVKDGYRIHRVRSLVEPGRTVPVHAVLQKQTGLLIVRSGLIRGARILVDGKDCGKTPSRVHVTADERHMVEVRKPGMRSQAVELKVSAGEKREVEVKLVPEGFKEGPSGWLTVRSTPPALIYLDGSPLGSSPLTKVRLPARRYKLTLKNPALGLQKVVPVVIRRNKTEELDVNLR
jgi:hypothetical protein